MADVQLENGYTKVANAIMEALIKTNMSPYESSITWAVVRLTYGWNKVWTVITYEDFREYTQITQNWHIWRTVRRLQQRNIIEMRIRQFNFREYSLQKNYETWDLSPVEETSPRKETSPSVETKASPVVETKASPV